MKKLLDITYREIDGHELKLDVFLPEEDALFSEKPPVIFWVHGGAWLAGDRKWCGLQKQTERGYAVVSVDYRLTDVAPFPACIEDCKYALTFLRENANEYPVDLTRVCVAGESAGGHLVALMGVSAGHIDWEPEGSDCSVQAVIDICGPVWKLPTVMADDDDINEDKNEPSVLTKLFGTPYYLKKGKQIAAAASPLTYIDGSEPPFLIIHGDKDDIVPIEHSRNLRNALEEAGNDVMMHTVLAGGHSFICPTAEAVTNGFLDFVFKGIKPATPEWT